MNRTSSSTSISPSAAPEVAPDPERVRGEYLARALNLLGEDALKPRCDACHEPSDEPLRHAEYMLHIGLVVVFFHKSIRGQLCRDCRQKYFWDYTLLTLVFGWWGVISFFVTPIILALNVFRHLRARFAPAVPSPANIRQWGTAVLVVGVLNVLYLLVMGVLFGWSVASDRRPSPRVADYLTPALVLAIWLSAALVMIVGALRMRALKSYPLAVVACFLAMVPGLIGSFLLGFPIGLLALVRLLKAEVRSAFT